VYDIPCFSVGTDNESMLSKKASAQEQREDPETCPCPIHVETDPICRQQKKESFMPGCDKMGCIAIFG
jgi:hypothetical protein